MKFFEGISVGAELKSAVELIDAQLAELGASEIETHLRHKAALTILEADTTARQIESMRANRRALLVARNETAAGLLRGKAAGLREEAERIRAAAETHVLALAELGVQVLGELDSELKKIGGEADELERDARRTECMPPRANGNERAGTVQELISAVYAIHAIPPAIAAIEAWAAEQLEGMGANTPFEFHLIWGGGKIDTAYSAVTWSRRAA